MRATDITGDLEGWSWFSLLPHKIFEINIRYPFLKSLSVIAFPECISLFFFFSAIFSSGSKLQSHSFLSPHPSSVSPFQFLGSLDPFTLSSSGNVILFRYRAEQLALHFLLRLGFTSAYLKKHITLLNKKASPQEFNTKELADLAISVFLQSPLCPCCPSPKLCKWKCSTSTLIFPWVSVT